MLKASLQKLYGRRHDLVEHYEIFISQITMDLFLLRLFFVFPISPTRLLSDLTTYVSNMAGAL
jgi:hypothetical protein